MEGRVGMRELRKPENHCTIMVFLHSLSPSVIRDLCT